MFSEVPSQLGTVFFHDESDVIKKALTPNWGIEALESFVTPSWIFLHRSEKIVSLYIRIKLLTEPN